MNIVDSTELIITPEKRIYHLNLTKEEIADTILLVGDPDRVKIISDKFDNITHKINHREFTTHTGNLKGKEISVISTGIGTDNIDIVVNELDALVNINFENRTINKKKKSLKLIRLGTTGALQKHIEINSFLVSKYALGFDGLAHFYKHKEYMEEELVKAYITHSEWPDELARPYCVKASADLLNMFEELASGITATASGFYGPQGRSLRLNPSIKHLHEKMQSFHYNENLITNFEMEASALYYLGQNLGHSTITICAVLGNRITKKYSENYKKTMSNMIDLVLEKLCY